MTGSQSPASAFARSCSSRSVIPERAECTTSGRKPSSSRSRTTAATFFQLLTLETLVPPNFRTTQWESEWLVIERSPSGSRCFRSRGRAPIASHVVVDVLQLLLKALLGKHVLELAPCRLSALHHGLPPVDAVDEAVVILFLRAGHEFLVEVEVFLVSFHVTP